MELGAMVRDLGVAARLGVRVLRRRIAGRADRLPEPQAWRAELHEWLAALPAGVVTEHRFVELPARRPPWSDSGLGVVAGEPVSWFATGRVYLSVALDLWVDPSFQLWGRIGTAGPVFRGTRATHTFTARTSGPLQLASYFPGEWSSPDGTLGAGAGDYDTVSGSMTVLVIRWRAGTDVAALLARSARRPASVQGELERLCAPVASPQGWDYLWNLGPGEIYRPELGPDGRATICCETHGDVGILRRPAEVPLRPGTTLHWRWRVDRLPADLREDSLLSHDYLSIAVEFDDGQDLTYYWSAALPVGTVYRCPLPTWRDRETHVVVRSGASGLGDWLEESRDLEADYRRIIGGPARSVVRVWLIAVSLHLRGHGRCEYAGIELRSAGQVTKVL